MATIRLGAQKEFNLTIKMKSVAGDFTSTFALFDILPSETILGLKKMIQGKTGLRAAYQKLSFDGQPLAEDSWTLERYRIVEGSTLVVTSAAPVGRKMLESSKDEVFNIEIRYSGGGTMYVAYKVQVAPTDTIADVKKYAFALLRIPVECQELYLEGVGDRVYQPWRSLSEDSRTLESYGIRAGAIGAWPNLRVKKNC